MAADLKDYHVHLQIIKVVIFDVILTFVDISTDFMNGVSLMQRGEPVLGQLTIGIIWIPGFLVIVWLIFRRILRVDSTKTLILIGPPAGILFPFWAPLIYIYSLFVMMKDSEQFQMWYVYAIYFKGLEGFSESAPQLLLNGYTIIISSKSNYIQLLAMMFSLLSITKSASENHFIQLRNEKPSFRKILIASPFFCMHIVYRITLYSFIIAYIGKYTLIPISLSILVTILLARNMLCSHVICIFWTSIGSLFSATAYKHIEHGQNKGPGNLDLPQTLEFYFWNSFTTWVFGTSTLYWTLFYLDTEKNNK